MQKYALLAVLLCTALFFPGCNFSLTDPDDEDPAWEDVQGVNFPVYVDHFADYIQTDENGNEMGYVVFGEGGVDHDWETILYDPDNAYLRGIFGLAGGAGAKDGFDVCVRAIDTADNAELSAQISWEGIPTGFTTPHTFTHQGLYNPSLPGLYSVSLEDYSFSGPDVTLDQPSGTYTFTYAGQYNSGVPVELSSFTAVLTAQSYVALSWVSQSETNMLGYRVYRGDTDALAAALMITGSIIPATNTSSPQSYSITDTEVETGHSYYYWLEAIDFAGSQFFGPVSVTVQGQEPPPVPTANAVSAAYPNPCSSVFNLDLSVRVGFTADVVLIDNAHSLRHTWNLAAGFHRLGADVSGLEPGLYRVFVKFGDLEYAYGDVLVSR